MITVVIQIGNTDNKLTQNAWAHYVAAVEDIIATNANEIHFFGGSPNWYPWQNVAWVIITEHVKKLRTALTEIRKTYGQDSVAWLSGMPEFI